MQVTLAGFKVKRNIPVLAAEDCRSCPYDYFLARTKPNALILFSDDSILQPGQSKAAIYHNYLTGRIRKIAFG